MLVRLIKSTMKRVDNNNSVDLLQRVFKGNVKFNPTLQKEMERGIKKINDYPETRWGYIYMCTKDILEKKWDKLCEMKEEIRKVVVGSDFFFKETTTKVILMTLKLALEPLFFFVLEFLLQNDRLNISSFLVFTLEPQQQY